MDLGTLITVDQLSKAMSEHPTQVVVLDASWHQPATNRDGRAEFQAEHIPGAQFFDLEEICDKKSPYEFMLPSVEEFEAYVGGLGIKNGTHVVLYESEPSGFYSSPRAWYIFRVFGHKEVSILNGGYNRWKTEGHPVTKEVPTVEKQAYKATYHPEIVVSCDEIVDNIQTKKWQVLDARSVGRFTGAENEPTGR